MQANNIISTGEKSLQKIRKFAKKPFQNLSKLRPYHIACFAFLAFEIGVFVYALTGGGR